MNVQASKAGKQSWMMDDQVDQSSELALQIMNIMEQGIIVWSADGICELHNTRIYDVLEVTASDISIGSSRDAFLDMAVERGEFGEGERQKALTTFKTLKPFSFDRQLPSGRVVSTNARPARGGGYVVTYTDVTEARKVARDLVEAINEADVAEKRMADVVALERSRQRSAQMLGDLDEWLQSVKSLPELFEIVSTFMERLLPDTFGELLVYSNSRDVLEAACAWRMDHAHPHIAPDSCWALRRGRSYAYAPETLSFLCEHVKSDAQTDASPYICVPIIAHGDTVGLLHIGFSGQGGDDDLHDPKAFAVRCGERISMAIANVKLRDELHSQSIRDPLTGLYNRRYFMDAMRHAIGDAVSKQKPFSLISFDADKFKQFNDNHGHDAGDTVLQAIAEQALATMPPNAICCRLGGEEFAIILPDANIEAGVSIAERLKQAICKTKVNYVHGVLPNVTVSAGVAQYGEHGTTPKGLLKQADLALYEAKANGRNCVVAVRGAS